MSDLDEEDTLDDACLHGVPFNEDCDICDAEYVASVDEVDDDDDDDESEEGDPDFSGDDDDDELDSDEDDDTEDEPDLDPEEAN